MRLHLSGIGKKYRINELRHRDSLVGRISEVLNFSSKFSVKVNARSFSSGDFLWALKDINLQIEEGQVLGLIGKNGSGKSTLLKIISRITQPTEGVIRIHGRVGALLEVGTGFHPDLSGIDNVYLNGSILGMPRNEIKKLMPAIIDFSEIGKFSDTPVKHYSSGMFMRLGFSVAAHLNTEIMLIDEVLAVGDAAFQKKCKDKIRDIARSGKTIIFTSHDMFSIKEICDKCMVLSAGVTAYSGDVEEGIQKYHSLI